MREPETQESVSAWSTATFGRVTRPIILARRAAEEMKELLAVFNNDWNWSGAAEEAADVVIVLYSFLTSIGANLQEEIDRKMAVNRAREWDVAGDGTGQHR